MTRVYLLALLGLVLLSTALSAQDFNLIGTDGSQPSITSNAYAFSPEGLPIAIPEGELSATVNGTSATLSAVFTNPGAPTAISVVVCIDASESMGANNNRHLVIARRAARGIASLLGGGDEVALMQFSDRPTLLHGLTRDLDLYDQALDLVEVREGSSLNNALTDESVGAIPHLRAAQQKRVVLVLTDASEVFDAGRAQQLAEAFQASVYSVSIRSNVSSTLAQLSNATGGISIGTEVDEATTAARACIAHAKNRAYTLLTVVPPEPCAKNRTLEVSWSDVSRSVAVDDQIVGVAGLEWSTPGLEFGDEGTAGTRTVRLTARGSAITVNSITSDAVEFDLETSVPGGTVIEEDQFLDLVVSYTGSPRGAFGSLTVNSTGCPVDPLYLRGGSLTTGDVLEVTAPAGGETFTAGSTTTIEWTNTLPQDFVRIDLSTDGGASWKPLTESASGNSWEWRTGPETTTGGKIRVQKTAVVDSGVAVMNGHIGPVYASEVLRDDYGVVTGGHDGTVRLWNVETGASLKQLGTHNTWVWTLAPHPSELVVASGSHDGSVRIWDVESGRRIGTYLADSRVWIVSFSPDGSILAVGTENSITLISYPGLQEIRSERLTEQRVQAADFSSDGRFLLVGEGQTATVRRVDDLSITQRFTNHTGQIYAGVFSNDGSVAYTAGADRMIMAWSVANANVIAQTPAATGSILDLDISPDGETILSGGTDGTAKTWAATDLSPLNSYAGHLGAVYGSRFNEDGTIVTTASTDQTARSWNIEGATLVEDESSSTFSVVGSTLDASNVSFGNVVVRFGSERSQVMIRNTGSEPVIINSARLVQGDVFDFSVDEGLFPVEVPGGGDLTFSTKFNPTTADARSATLRFATGVGTVDATLSGRGIQPDISFNRFLPYPTSQILDFGRVVAGQQSRDSLITLRLIGSEPIAFTSVTVVGLQSNAFNILEGDGEFTITPTFPRNIRVQFQPSEVGRFAAEMVLTREDNSTFIVRLYGEGTGDARIFSETTALLFSTEQCSRVTQIELLPVTNTGNSDLEVFTVAVSGADRDEFEIRNAPTTIARGQTENVEVAFIPRSIGVKDARIAITSNGAGNNNGALSIPIVARQDSTAFEISVPSIQFESVNEGETAVQQVNLINTGTTPLVWESTPINVGDFTILEIDPPITQPGSQSAVTVQFNGGVVNEEYSESYTFTEPVCSSSASLSMTATVQSYIGVTISIDSVGGNIGTLVQVPIRLTNLVNFDRTDITEIGARIAVNGTILSASPTSSNIGTFLPNGTRYFDIAIPVRTDEEIATSLEFQVNWGNDTGSFVRVDSVWINDTVLVRSDPGFVQINDLCREGGPRLFLARQERGEGIRASVIPNPVTHTSTIDLNVVENGPTRLEVVDLTGRVLETLIDRDLQRGRYLVPFDGSAFETGTYVIVVQTRTQRLSNRISVVR